MFWNKAYGKKKLENLKTLVSSPLPVLGLTVSRNAIFPEHSGCVTDSNGGQNWIILILGEVTYLKLFTSALFFNARKREKVGEERERVVRSTWVGVGVASPGNTRYPSGFGPLFADLDPPPPPLLDAGGGGRANPRRGVQIRCDTGTITASDRQKSLRKRETKRKYLIKQTKQIRFLNLEHDH